MIFTTMDNYHSNARRKPNTKEYEDNFEKINWSNKIKKGQINGKEKSSQKGSKKNSKVL